ncbi:hypothetical protein F9L33_11000 [Amylibacter sp. SFDW26]|nr:hypothetical protein F9L33_11000 [Amylibacter sp. SFDW26]
MTTDARPNNWKAPLRDPNTVMRLSQMGSFHQSRLSFMRALLRRLQSEEWQFEVKAFQIDDTCVGHAVYSAIGPTHTYSLIAFAHDLPDDMRSDRVIATAWDCTFTLFDGVPTDADIERLSQNVPYQEAGRISPSELSLSRANRSNRLWGHVVDRLADGRQPDPELIRSVGYLMRTTAVYGNGKFGAADRTSFMHRPMMADPFRVELLSVYLTRAFVMDLVEHAARTKGGDKAITLDPNLRREFGIGNSTGLGMAPFLTFHPALLNNWIASREEAFSLVRSVETASTSERTTFKNFLSRAIKNADDWQSEHPLQIEKITALRSDLSTLNAHVENADLSQPYAWDALATWAADNLSTEGQEQLVSLLLEPYPDLVDDLANCMKADEAETFAIDGTKTVSDTLGCIYENYAWALDNDYSCPDSRSRFWYVSEEKLEPRLGERFEEDGGDLEQPHTIAQDIDKFCKVLELWPSSALLADVLMKHPEYRQVARRAQLTQKLPYAEIRDNQISANMLPIDMLRCKLSFFGATKFDPRSDRWLRICMYQNAPFPDELATAPFDDWAYPSID